MSLVTVQRNPESEFNTDENKQEESEIIDKNFNENINEYGSNFISNTDNEIDDIESSSLIEKYFVLRDAALLLPKYRSNSICTLPNFANTDNLNDANSNGNCNTNTSKTDILKHLNEMISLLRPHDTICVAIRLTSYVPDRIRYLTVIENTQRNDHNNTHSTNSALIGFDITKNNLATIGLVLPIYSNCDIRLDGDGSFKFYTHNSTTHLFKPVSIQAMWYAYQYLHKRCSKARKYISNEQPSSNISNTWLNTYWYNTKHKSEQYLLYEWVQNEERSAQRDDYMTPYFDATHTTSSSSSSSASLPSTTNNIIDTNERQILREIKQNIKEIMLSSEDNYGSMSSSTIRKLLEEKLNMNLTKYKHHIDAFIFQLYNQLVECASQILPHLYLGSEWNASDYEHLIESNVTHILNISTEVDNFFIGSFKYLNIRVDDVVTSNILKEFDRAYKFINEAKDNQSSCFVHCKMGVSRSASICIAYVMKEMNKSVIDALIHVKSKRSCVNPNDGFIHQLLTYESILNARRSKIYQFNETKSDFSESYETQNEINDTINKIKLISSANSINGQSFDISDTVEFRRSCSVKLRERNSDIKRTSSYLNDTNFDMVGVRKLAEDFLRNSVLNNSQTNLLQTSTSTTNIDTQNEFVPIGIVKRQVESINFKSRPCTPEDNLDTNNQLNDDSNSNSNSKIETQTINLDTNNSLSSSPINDENIKIQSPDSKRVKITTDTLLDTCVIKRDSKLNRSKKVFEFLADKLRNSSNYDDLDTQNDTSTQIQTIINENRKSTNSYLLIDSDNTSINTTNDTTTTSNKRRDMGKSHPLTILTSKNDS